MGGQVGQKNGVPRANPGAEADPTESSSIYLASSRSLKYSQEAHRNDPVTIKKSKSKPKNQKFARGRLEEFHYPYRPKYPAVPYFGMCRLEDFAFAESDKLGKGGFGKVFLATHKPSGVKTALKFVPAVTAKNIRHVELEETIHHSLRHPFISIHFCTMRTVDKEIIFATQYFPGGNLWKQLKSMHPYPFHTIQKYIAQLLTAIKYLHDQCIVYRDIKADNVMTDYLDNIKLIDFGLSVFDCDNRLSSLAGTLEYMAPEIASGTSYGRAVDYFSIGILLYQIYVGRLPHSHKDFSSRASMIKALGKGIAIASTGNRSVDSFISLLTTKDPLKRWNLIYEKFSQIREHEFFYGFEWSDIDHRTTYLAQYPPASTIQPK